ncbi:dead end protein 1 isoform X1 [Silurus meridionalis]|uniref:RRM domain-containing protein n=2 Tax=Silurus meridionalis TaxID=175797 RepID=A0A8T0B6Q3_SILME|nr:dead end protein 1 isoform X1 [Silurus meridionalis]KAF7702366.1 hypothetical protein HF521_001649 [Silurus meridionalis]
MLQMVNQQRIKSLERWLQETKITLTQINGQRRYGAPPPGWTGPVPGPGCEVFISQIPRDVFEDELIPLFQSVAPLYEFRLMMNFSGQNRGFAYAKYGDVASMTAAIRALNMYPLQGGFKLAVKRSTEKRQLCLSNLPPNTKSKELLTVLRQIADGVEGVTMRTTGPKEKDVIALVLYSSHYTASMAKKVLVAALKDLCGMSICVRWSPGNGKPRHEEHGEENPLIPPGLKPMAINCLTPPRFQLSQNPKPSPAALLDSQVISRADGYPTSQVMSRMLPLSKEEPLHDSVYQLRWLCELHGLGMPLYNVRYDHTGSDGLLYFTYKVVVSGLAIPFYGITHVLPSTSTSNIEAEVHRAAAKQLLNAMRKHCVMFDLFGFLSFWSDFAVVVLLLCVETY